MHIPNIPGYTSGEVKALFNNLSQNFVDQENKAEQKQKDADKADQADRDRS